MQQGNLLVEDLGQNVDADGFLARLAKFNVPLAEDFILGFEQHDLRQHLVGEGARHNEGGMTRSAPKVDETTLCEEDDVAAVFHQVTVDLRLDVLDALGVGFKPCHVDFNVKMSNI